MEENQTEESNTLDSAAAPEIAEQEAEKPQATVTTPLSLPEELESYFNGDKKLALFFSTWLNNGMNAGRAYLALHPNTSLASARVLGCRELKKVNISTILEAYGLTLEKYLHQLIDGLEAQRWNPDANDFEPDHKVRRAYHEALGKLLMIETPREVSSGGLYTAHNQQNNKYYYSSAEELASDIRAEAARREQLKNQETSTTPSSSPESTNQPVL